MWPDCRLSPFLPAIPKHFQHHGQLAPIGEKTNPVYDTVRNVRTSEKTRHHVHYCIVFKECATPLHKVKNMGEFFAVLADLMKC